MSLTGALRTPIQQDPLGVRRRIEASGRSRSLWVLGALLTVAATAPAALTGQGADAQGSPLLDDLAFLVGSWAGTIDGTVGSGTGQRQYRPIVRGRYLLMTHASYRPPQELAPEGDAHEEWSIFSYDSAREKIVMREFFVEGYVSRADCELGADPWRLTCWDDAVESGPELSLRLTLEALDEDRFSEVFEIFGPDRQRLVRFDNEWIRTGVP